MSGRVLVVTYYFPPLGGVGVQRTLKYITYLPHWGWQPIVVTPRNPAYTVRDASLLDVLPPDLEVHRTASLEPGQLHNAIIRRLGGEGTGSSGAATDPAGRPAGAGRLARLASKSASGTPCSSPTRRSAGFRSGRGPGGGPIGGPGSTSSTRPPRRYPPTSSPGS